MAGQTSWTFLVSLNEVDRQHFGIIYQPFTNEMFLGNYNSSEFISNSISKSLKVRNCRCLSNAISHTTDSQMGNEDENHIMDFTI